VYFLEVPIRREIVAGGRRTYEALMDGLSNFLLHGADDVCVLNSRGRVQEEWKGGERRGEEGRETVHVI
jgi:hypothetical protein